MNMQHQGGWKQWWQGGEPLIWLNAAAIAISMIAVLGLLLLLLVRGSTHFWPTAILAVEYAPPGGPAGMVVGQQRLSEYVSREQVLASGVELPATAEQLQRVLVQVGNRDISGVDFRWLLLNFAGEPDYPPGLMVVERREWGNLYGYLHAVHAAGSPAPVHAVDEPDASAVWQDFQRSIERVNRIQQRIDALQRGDIARINYRMEKLRLQQRAVSLGQHAEAQEPELQRQISAERQELILQYDSLERELQQLKQNAAADRYSVMLSNGEVREFPVEKIVRAYRPNSLSLGGKLSIYGQRLWEFVAGEPREANTEGGVFPAIFGTVLMVLLMSVLVTPFGILAAVYLREYAKQGLLTRLIRIAVNNLAGVPSIVYGVFSLGFFVYLLGGSIDQLFYTEALPAPTFGTPGLFWAALTLALLTLPVVIVATEEGLARLPRSLREASLALGATRLQTILWVVLPGASPALITGMILAVARAAGEVAPLMLVGVVKMAPTLPLDGNFPFLHLERKFMHLGFHIYDVGFQSPNIEAARPLVYATALLLVAVVMGLNLVAIRIRNRLREQYKSEDM
jgi:phosphate transport system permease protein